MYCAETRGLSHQFAGHPAVLNNISMQVPMGSIYGFLGPNGAGKTTTLRILLGLIKKQQGELFIFNKPLHRHRMELLKRVGTMIETPRAAVVADSIGKAAEFFSFGTNDLTQTTIGINIIYCA